MFKSATLIALMLQAENVSCFSPNAKVSGRAFNIDTELNGYLDQLAPEAPKGAAPVSYMAKIVTSPKPSAITSYLDTVSGATPEPVAAPAYSPPAAPAAPAYTAPPAPAAPAYSAPTAGATSNAYDYTNTFSHTNPDTQQTFTHTHQHVHSYSYNYDNDSVTIGDDQKVNVQVSSSSASASPVFTASGGPAIAAAAATYLSALGTNVMASGGGTAMTNPHLATIPVTAPPCTGYSTLGNDHLNIMPVTAPGCKGSSTLGVSHLDYVSGATLVFGDY